MTIVIVFSLFLVAQPIVAVQTQLTQTASQSDATTLEEGGIDIRRNKTGDYADYCDAKNATTISSGVRSDLLAPTDRDVVKPNISRGEYVTVNLSYDGPEGKHLLIYGSASEVSFSAVNGSGPSDIPSSVPVEVINSYYDSDNQLFESSLEDLYKTPQSGEGYLLVAVQPGQTQFRVYAQRDNPCFALQSAGKNYLYSDTVVSPKKSADGGAGPWKLAFTVNNKTPPPIS